MTKEEERRKVLLDVNEIWFKSRGTNIYLAKWGVVYVITFLVVLIIFGCSERFELTILNYISATLLLIEYIILCLNLWQAGKRYWSKWQGNPQEPLELPKTPKYTWKWWTIDMEKY